MASDNKERLYGDLKRKILTMELEPGAHLDETTFSARYGVSRTPLRDVFRRLAGEGYIQIRDNRGTIVSPMNHKTMRDFFLTAPLIYSSVARLAAQNARPAQIAQLREAQCEFRKSVEKESIDDMGFWNGQFHMIMGEMADNQYIMPSLQRLLIDHARIGQTFWRSRTPETAQRIGDAVDQHDRFIDLIEAGDEEGAVALTLDHWALSRNHIESFVRPDPLPITVPCSA
jgi:DNA-binding GntR family transcriptional regulator